MKKIEIKYIDCPRCGERYALTPIYETEKTIITLVKEPPIIAWRNDHFCKINNKGENN